MAARLHAVPQDNTGSSLLAQFPPTVTLDSPVLASSITLPDQPVVAYYVFSGSPSTNAADHLNLIELARRKVLAQNVNRGILDSLLPSVHITKDASKLYVFGLASQDVPSPTSAALAALQFEGLSLSDNSTFTTNSIYPCSAACSIQTAPCPECLKPFPKTARSASSAAHLLPRKHLRMPFHHFLSAVRDRLIDDITETSKLNPNSRQAIRLKDGFILGPAAASSEWSAGWEHHARSRPLVFTHLQVHLSQTPFSARLLIHPVLRPTFYFPLCATLPVPSGTPVVLLPYGIPAYYLNTYTGPASALTAPFNDALVGLGAGEWKGAHTKRHVQSDASTSSTTSCDRKDPSYIIAWLAVQNKQGEDKGMPIIWPARLCLSYHPNSPSPHARTPLAYNPELPAQLQASPPPPPPTIPQKRDPLSTPISRRPRTVTSSPTTESLRAFRTLTLTANPSPRDVNKVASEVSGYVDSVAKERERERERLKREREGTTTRGRATSTSGPTSTSTPSAVVDQPTPGSSSVTAPPPEAMVDIAHGTPAAEDILMDEDLPSSQDSTDSLFSPPAGENTPPPDDVMHSSSDSEVKAERMDVDTMPIPIEPAPHTDVLSNFDPFNGLDASWNQPSNTFLDMGYDMGFNMNMDSLSESRMGRIGDGDFDMDEGFGDFTDEDFSFFDAPTTQTRSVPIPVPPIRLDNTIHVNEGLTPTAGAASLGYSPHPIGDDLSGPGPPVAAMSLTSSWASNLTEALTPHLGDVVPPAPELLPPSPSKTPSSYSAPATPAVQLSDGFGADDTSIPSGPRIFDPIPFAPSHRIADGKYAVGKFALASPNNMEDTMETKLFPSSAPSASTGWKWKYGLATDPRIGVMRRLVGMKRKVLGQGKREPPMSPSWVREHEDWESSTPSPWVQDSKSDGESEDDEPWVDDDDAATISRPSTPPPSYLPLGPTLLQTQFHHSRLLPLSSPLRPPGAVVSSTPCSAHPTSVPTPVSPAAILGAASEKSKSLEAAAQLLAAEIVENPVWADAWRANAAVSMAASSLPVDIWHVDVNRVATLLDNVGPTLSTGTLRAVYSPVCKSDAIVQVMPTALRFWEKLGLGPKAGLKNVTAFVFYEAGGPERESQIAAWIDQVSATYSARNYGGHAVGVSTSCSRPGLVPIRLDQVKKTLGTLQPSPQDHLVFYIITPSSTSAPASSTLRPLFSAIKRALKAYPDSGILFHLVPEAHVNGGLDDPNVVHGGLEILVASVYDRILQPVERAMSRRLFDLTPRTRACFHAPAFALASGFSAMTRHSGPRVSYTLESHPSSLDVVDRHTLLHVGYRISSCRQWLLASCTDERGDEYDWGAWLLPAESVESFIVSQIWTFTQAFAGRANVEWRVGIAKVGAMGENELEAWVIHLQDVIAAAAAAPPMHISLLVVEYENTWTLVPPSGTRTIFGLPVSSRPTPRTPSGSVLGDMTYKTYAAFPALDLTYVPALNSASAVTSTSYPSDKPYIPDCEEDELPAHQYSHPRARRMSTLIHVPTSNDHTAISMVHVYQLHSVISPHSSVTRSATVTTELLDQNLDAVESFDDAALHDIVHNYHALAVLARMRWRAPVAPTLPFHLGALEMMRAALVGSPSTDS
ncbi:hypothetical protein POSPLADRAFT_1048016 [Postia placenta MAD-698-R-SB12]|uniref:Mediator of RNA polymerase II transcription subunit 13 n=1 Tax=Postia placenta MAD-698-R-SB12 TaxID=670580 RepID=A0A1X6MW77_9APHY|nr:hypothetical protein POSPLADRAFT_1048016 [Postia placenta MAD-698-R-SB12]OSX60611.1 hypothetical protein POSPLADRAFT_1048016 [Postia placenta MAD-698-R-SB12]